MSLGDIFCSAVSPHELCLSHTPLRRKAYQWAISVKPELFLWACSEPARKMSTVFLARPRLTNWRIFRRAGLAAGPFNVAIGDADFAVGLGRTNSPRQLVFPRGLLIALLLPWGSKVNHYISLSLSYSIVEPQKLPSYPFPPTILASASGIWKRRSRSIIFTSQFLL
jgi:hypothetical protein